MKKKNKKILFVMIIIAILSLSACKTNSNVNNKDNSINQTIQVPKYSNILILNNNKLFNLQDNFFKEIEKINNIQYITYNLNNNVYVYLESLNGDKKDKKNKIKIINKNNKKSLDKSRIYLDLKLSREGGKIAYRSFKDNALKDAEGLQIYDINKGNKINLRSNVLVSGNLYDWYDENKIIYYGIVPNKQGSDKIYVYDFKKGYEKVLFDDIDGYCTYIFNVKDKGLLFLETKIDDYNLCFFNYKDNKKNEIAQNIGQVYDSVYNEKTNEIYFSAKQINSEVCSLYKISLENFNIDRINYDFPKNINKESSLAIDNNGNLIFSGFNTNKKEQNIYSYNSNENSILLISDIEGKYKIFKNNN